MIDSPTPRSFDPQRAVMEDYGKGLSAPFLRVTEMDRLDNQVERGAVPPDTRLLGFTIDDVLHTFPMSTVLAFNVVQCDIPDAPPWVMTFCNACNTGMVFDPTIDGRVLHFERRGAFDGLMLIYDHETETFWQHITGEAIHGASAGQRLSQIAPTRHLRADEALAQSGDARVLVHTLSPEQQKFARAMERMRSTPEKMDAMIGATIAPITEDTRRPRYELGLGVWDESGSLFVPLLALHNHNNLIPTRHNGRAVIVYQDENALSPVAVYADGEGARWSGDAIRLANGDRIRGGQVIGADGGARPLERPMQLLMRWYGFAITFPESAIVTHP